MPWVRFDDRFPWHRKVRRLTDAAYRLHHSAICWSSTYLTDGYVAAADLNLVSDVRKPVAAAQELVKAGLWDVDSDGWRIHDYLSYNPSREEVLEQRSRDAERKRRGRDAESRRTPPDVRPESNGTPLGIPTESVRPVPSRPVPSSTTTKPTVSSAREPRGTRLPEQFEITDEMLEWGRDHGAPSPQWLADHTERFRDYWRGVPGAKGRKLDWPGTWRNWIKTELDRCSNGNARASPRPTTDDKIRNTLALGAALAERQRKELAP